MNEMDYDKGNKWDWLIKEMNETDYVLKDMNKKNNGLKDGR